jgi:holo-[acyl-carrier protein] synthase
MSIVSSGTDIVECLRIAQLIDQHGEAFLRRIYTPKEIEYCSARSMSTQHYAARWAAKKAVLQALGVGLRGGMTWKDIEVQSERHGKARIGLAGVVRDVSVAKRINQIHVSLSSCRTMAVAFAILEREDDLQFDLE